MHLELIGKGAEILDYIAQKEPDKKKLRRQWSSRTVWKQIPRLKSQGLIVWQDDRYQVTDSGLYALARIWALRSRVGVARIVKLAARKFPDGATVQAYAPLTKLAKSDSKEMVMEDLKMPNAFLLYRTNARGQIAWRFLTCYGPGDLRISQRVHGKWQRLHIPE